MRVLYLFFLCVVLCVVFILTPFGFQYTINTIQKNFFPDVLYQSVSGHIFGPIVFHGVHGVHKKVECSVQRIELKWQWPIWIWMDGAHLEKMNLYGAHFTWKQKKIFLNHVELSHVVLHFDGSWQGSVIINQELFPGINRFFLTISGHNQHYQINHLDFLTPNGWWLFKGRGTAHSVTLTGHGADVAGQMTVNWKRTLQNEWMYSGFGAVQWRKKNMAWRGDFSSKTDQIHFLIDGHGGNTGAFSEWSLSGDGNLRNALHCSFQSKSIPQIQGALTLYNRGREIALNIQDRGTWSVQAAWKGSLGLDHVWRGNLIQGQLIAPHLGLLHVVRNPSVWEISTHRARISARLVSQTNDVLQTDWSWSAAHPWLWRSQGVAHFRSIPLSWRATVEGMQSAVLKVQAHAHVTQNQINLRGMPIEIEYAHADCDAVSTHSHCVVQVLTKTRDQLTLRAQSAHGVSDPLHLLMQPIEGDIHVHIAHIEKFSVLMPSTMHPTGMIQGQLQLAGSLKEPAITGPVQWIHGGLTLPKPQVRLEHIQLHMQIDKNQGQYRAEAWSGKPVRIEGAVSWRPWATTAHITGTDLIIWNTPGYWIRATTDLHMSLSHWLYTITGDVDVTQAQINPGTFSIIKLTDDAKIVGLSESLPWHMVLNVNVSSGWNTHFNAQGFSAQLIGKMHLSRTPTQTQIVAHGQLTASGVFQKNDIEFKIAPHSVIVYAHDPLSNPHLSLRIFRNISIATSSALSSTGLTQTELGIDIQGSVSDIRITPYSVNLKLNKSDILSYLFLNQPANSAGGALSSLGVIANMIRGVQTANTSSFSLTKIQKSLGIVELGVQQQLYVDALGTPWGINQSAFVVGKFLTPHLYVRYNRGLSSAITIYEVRYVINPHWFIQTEMGSKSDIGMGIDVMYHVSRTKFPW